MNYSIATVKAKPSRAVQLLERLLTDKVFDEETLSRELIVKTRTLERYRAGDTPIPPERQLCLALLTIERAPPTYRRLGTQLRDQVNATVRFHERMNANGELPILERPTREY